MSEKRIPIVPIPPRGAFAHHGERRVRVSTRGPFPSFSVDDDSSLSYVIAVLRHGRDLPLTFAVSGACLGPRSESGRFLDALGRSIDLRRDAVWIIAPAPLEWAPPTGDRVPPIVVLDLTNELDSRIASNLSVDMLFLPCEDGGDEAVLNRLIGRAPLVVVPRDASRASDLTAIADEPNVMVLQWDAAQLTIGRRLVNLEYRATASEAAATAEVDLDAIGKHLANLARLLKPRRERRSEFRIALAGLIPTFGARPRWGEDLLNLAHAYKWPDWAVQTLPFLYLRLHDEVDGEVYAVVWQRFAEWLTKPETYLTGREKICNGEMWEVRLPKEIDAVMAELNAQAYENLRGNPYHGDSAFFGRISDAVDAVAQTSGRLETPLRDLSRALRRPA